MEINYYKKSIYLIQYNNKKDISVSFGMIKGIIKSDIIYSCFANSNSKGLPIFNLSNKKIIGIHAYRLNDNNYNKGKLFLKDIVETIFEELNQMKKNEITLLINIDKKDINKKIFFLDNYDNDHNNLKELNEFNTDLYIDNNKIKYNKYFIAEKEGQY